MQLKEKKNIRITYHPSALRFHLLFALFLERCLKSVSTVPCVWQAVTMPVMELSSSLPDQQSGTEGIVGTVVALWRLLRLVWEHGWKKKKQPDVRRGTK